MPFGIKFKEIIFGDASLFLFFSLISNFLDISVFQLQFVFQCRKKMGSVRQNWSSIWNTLFKHDYTLALVLQSKHPNSLSKIVSLSSIFITIFVHERFPFFRKNNILYLCLMMVKLKYLENLLQQLPCVSFLLIAN